MAKDAWKIGNLKKADAKALAKWWNANTKHYHFVRCTNPQESIKRRRYEVYR